jgi:hypothetical protein
MGMSSRTVIQPEHQHWQTSSLTMTMSGGAHRKHVTKRYQVPHRNVKLVASQQRSCGSPSSRCYRHHPGAVTGSRAGSRTASVSLSSSPWPGPPPCRLHCWSGRAPGCRCWPTVALSASTCSGRLWPDRRWRSSRRLLEAWSSTAHIRRDPTRRRAWLRASQADSAVRRWQRSRPSCLHSGTCALVRYRTPAPPSISRPAPSMGMFDSCGLVLAAILAASSHWRDVTRNRWPGQRLRGELHLA